MAAISPQGSSEAEVPANGHHREVAHLRPLVGDDRNDARPEILYGALLALGAATLSMGLRTAGKSAEFVSDLVARSIGLTPLQPGIQRLSQRWDQEREALLAGVDRSIASLVEMVLDRIDLTQLVIERVDVDRIIDECVDIDGVIQRADIIGVAQDVIQQLDLPEIIRESSSTMGTETVEGLRLRGMDADRSLARLVDRVLNRTNGREAPPT